MYWKNRSIKEQYREEMLQRSLSEPLTRFLDFETNAFILLKNYDETIEFLKNSTIEEIAWACEVLDEMAWGFSVDQVEKILNVFKDKLIEFPNVDDYCEVEYSLELNIAQGILEERKTSQGNQ